MTDVKPKVRLVDLPLKRLRPKKEFEDKVSFDVLVSKSGRTQGHITLSEIEKLAKRRRTSVGELIRHLLILERRNQKYALFPGREPLITDPQMGFGNAQMIKVADDAAAKDATIEAAIDAFYDEEDSSLDGHPTH